MNRTRLTLIDILQPRRYQGNPERSRVTRTILQPEIDAFEQLEAQAGAQKSALAGRRAVESASQLAGA